MAAWKGAVVFRGQILLFVAIVTLSAPVFGQKTQMLSRFDLDPAGSPGIDLLVSVGPPAAPIGNDFAPRNVDPTFVPGMVSNQPLHLVSQSQDAIMLDGPGRILFTGPSDEVEAYIGHGALPVSTGTGGLTRLATDRPTPYFFTRGQKLFLYYIIPPGYAERTFARMFGDGSRSVLTLLAVPPIDPAPEFSNNTSPKRAPSTHTKARHRERNLDPPAPQRRPSLALLTGQVKTGMVASSGKNPSSMSCRKPFQNLRDVLSKLRKAERPMQDKRPLFTFNWPPAEKCGRPKPVRSFAAKRKFSRSRS